MLSKTFCKAAPATQARHQQHVRGGSIVCHGLKENVAKLPPVTNIKCVRVPDAPWIVENAEGKRASLAIYNHMAKQYGGKLNRAAATEGLELYGEYVDEARSHPGSHPNIDLLIRVADNDLSFPMIVEEQQ